MTHLLHPVRPARAAIAAVLALTATPLLAQEMAPQVPAPPQAQSVPQATPPVASAPVAVPQTPPPAAALPGETSPAVAPVQPLAVPGTPPPVTGPVAAIAAPELNVPEVSEEPVSAARPAVRRAPPPRSAEPVAEPDTAGAMSDISDAPKADIVPAVPSAQEPVATEQSQSSAADTGSDNGEAAGWLAALLAALGLGGGAVALTRRRKRTAVTGTARVDHTEDAVASQPTHGLAGPHERPIASSPMAAAAMPPMVRHDHPAQRTGPHAARRPGEIDRQRLEAMIAQRPSRDNPFVTRPNRKRRAVFLMQNRYPVQSAA